MVEESSEKPCVACGWADDQQKLCCYSSHVILICGANNRGVWTIGSDLIPNERPNEDPQNKVKTLDLLRANTSIPAPKIVRDGVDASGRSFVLLERIHGQMLEEVWPSLSERQKTTTANQVVEVEPCKQLQSVNYIVIYPGCRSKPMLPRLTLFRPRTLECRMLYSVPCMIHSRNPSRHKPWRI